ncbi:hypothetical protein EV202_13112 [Bacteroides heparinolyticus]|uniref:Uncharacterized protein n=1 Tax=Prevotella heparinolytica TaxID=28113 RepID=A0A4R2LFK1_9BACE|nr:hypothetical protein [Bacteroides heparinolyticus]TCO87467.1 hypothetical protein EV202_13112 [Bacteroides heparinolyticus]
MIDKIDIYGLRDGVIEKVASIPCENTFHNSSLMTKDELSVSVVADSTLPIKVGDYCTMGGIVYRMNRDAEFTQKTEVQHEYSIVLEAPIYTLLDKVVCNRVTGSTKVVLTGKLRDFLELLTWNVNKSEDNPLGVDTGWKIGLCPDTEYKNIVLDGVSCRAALDNLRKAFNVEYYTSNKTINFVSHIENETGLTFTQGRGKGLYSLEQKNVDSSDVVTRLFPKGGTENVIPGEGDEEGRLVLPEKYIEDFSETSKVVERVVKFEDIHPTFQGKVGALSGENNRSFICNEIDFDIKELSVGSDARVNFLTGDLMGKAFEFFWDNSKKKITLIGQVDELALIDPSTQSRPVIPDTNKRLRGGELFTLTGLHMSGTYKENAINTLREKGREWLKYHCRKRVKYNLDVDYRMLRGKRTLSVGDLVTVKDKNRGINALIRIVSVERNLRTGKLSCVVSNYLDEKWEKKIEGQIASVQAAVSGGVGVSAAVDIIESNDAREFTDKRVLSALRTIREIEKKALSKEKSDRTPYSLEVGEDLTVDGNASVNHDLNVGRNATVGNDLTVMEILRALIKIETASLNVSGNSKTGTLDVAGKATARDVEVANQVTSLNAVIRALATIHNLTVDNTADIMHGIIRQYLSSDKFVSGFLGEGFKVWQDAAGLWHGELDMLTVRKTFTVFELVVQKIVHQGGMVIRSAAGGKITKVTDGGSYWRCEHDSSDDFVANDQVLCQVFTGTKMKRYWRLATSAGAGYFNLSKTDCEAGSATPEVGDEVAVLGNRTNAARQSAQIDCAVGANAPYRDDYAGINSYSLAGKLVTRTGNLSGIVDPDFGALSGFGLYSLNAYLKGMLRLTSGKTVETAIGEARSGAISVAATDAQAKANAAKASAISVAAGDAQAKADAAKQAAISAAASDAQSKAMAAETNAKTHAQAILDALQIGGRNYIVLSKLAAYTPYNAAWQVNGKVVSTQKVTATFITLRVDGFMPIAGEPYTLSGVMTKNGSPVTNAMWVTKTATTYATPKRFEVNDATGYFECTMVWKKANIWLLHTNIQGEVGNTITIDGLKLEKGTKATDWTPAPEDVEAGIAFEITKVRTDFDVREGQISSKVAEVNVKTQQAVSASQTATEKASQAAGSATLAGQKATEADGSAKAAKTSESNAGKSATSAANEAGKAKSSADAAAAKLITVTEKESNINQTAGQIATKVTEVTKQAGIASQAANNASGSASAAASSATTAGQKATDAANSANAANTALQTISTKQTQINQTAAEIDLKATRTEQAAGRAEEAEARVNIAADGVVINAAKQAAQLAVDGVQIGGRNLYRKSTEIVNLANAPAIQKEADADSAHGFKLTGRSGLVCGARIRSIIADNGDYVISFWGKSNGSGTPKFDICDNLCTGNATFTTEWKRFELKAKVRNYSAVDGLFIDIENLVWLYYWFRDFKVEKGTKATDWTPAPEDVEADATAKADAAKQSAISDAAAKYPTKTEYSAQLAVLNSSISSKVSQTDFNALGTRMSTAEQKITPSSIISTVSSTVESAKTAAINAAASDAKAKADAAKQAAISTAANDATAKANRAEANAKAHANNTFTPITTYNTKVAQLENLISLKAESSTVSGLTTRMAVAEEKITPGAINMVVKEQITTAVGNVQVGGRNYVILSKLESWIANTSVPVITGTDVNVMLTKDNTTEQQVIIRVKGYVPDAGMPYTVSGYMTLGGRPIKNSDFRVKRMNHELGTDNFHVDDSTGYFECTHKYNGSNPWLLNVKLTATTGTPVKISRFKFEKGTKASDWTLSPEDADAALQIGGRNLYRKSTVINNLINNPSIQKEADADSAHGFKLTGRSGLVCGARIRSIIADNGDYVISFWGKSNGSGTPKFDICDNLCTGNATFTTEWKRFELKAKVRNYSAVDGLFIDIENLVWLYYWFKDFKVEKGTKATDWTPAPEDVEADIALRPTKEEVKAGISITTGGINVFGKEISLAGKVTFASLDSSTQATINGKATTVALTSLQNSLGAMAYQNMVSLAKLDTTIVQGGYIKTNLIDANAVVTNSLLATKIAATDITTGRLTVIDGAKIAGFRVSGNNLSNMDNDGNFSNDASIIFRNDAKKCFAGIGGNVLPTSSGLRAVARFENEDTSDQWGAYANYAMIVSARGANDNCAIAILGGYVSRFAEKVEVVTSSRTIDISTTCVLCVNTSDITLTLPTMQKYDNGHVIEIKNLGNNSVTINTGYGYHIDGTQRRTYIHVDRGSHVTSLTIGGNGDAMRFVYARDINNGSQYGCWAQFKNPRDW